MNPINCSVRSSSSMGMDGIVILASCEYYRVHENLVQHPSHNISFLAIKMRSMYVKIALVKHLKLYDIKE